VPEGLDWQSLLELVTATSSRSTTGTSSTELGKHPGMLGVVFRKAQNRIQDPAKLRRLIVDLIDSEQWMTLDADVKGDAYEGLLEKNAPTEVRRRPVLHPAAADQGDGRGDAPEPGMTICDPACGTGGFFLAAYEYIVKHNKLDPRPRAEEAPPLRVRSGWEIVDNTARLCAMNLLLHGIGSGLRQPDRGRRRAARRPGRPVRHGADQPAVREEVVGQIVNAEGETERQT
jgi:type I restriction enzyme M protein